jgi:hypothetical protein
MLTLKFKAAQSGFFDREAVTDRLDAATRKNFNEFGRLVRARAQRSILIREGSASPGQPPHGHKSGFRERRSRSTGRVRTRRVSLLREFIFYSFDQQSKSVVVGPVRLNGTISSESLPALEYGGPSTAKIKGKRRRIRVAAHPFMRPAAAAELPQLPAMWRDSVR